MYAAKMYKRLLRGSDRHTSYMIFICPKKERNGTMFKIFNDKTLTPSQVIRFFFILAPKGETE